MINEGFVFVTGQSQGNPLVKMRIRSEIQGVLPFILRLWMSCKNPWLLKWMMFSKKISVSEIYVVLPPCKASWFGKTNSHILQWEERARGIFNHWNQIDYRLHYENFYTWQIIQQSGRLGHCVLYLDFFFENNIHTVGHVIVFQKEPTTKHLFQLLLERNCVSIVTPLLSYNTLQLYTYGPLPHSNALKCKYSF